MKNKTLYKASTILIPIIIFVLYLLHGFILKLMTFLPPCSFYSMYHLYCPSCGNTRSVTALLRGDILTSLRFNIVPIILSILSFIAYIELATYSFGKHIRLFPRSLRFHITLISILILYMIIRNFIPYLTP